MDLTKYYASIMEQYPEFVNQEQMCEICGICKKTAYKLEYSGKIPYTVEINHLIHTHKIKLTDVLTYLYEKECRQEADSEYMLFMREFYEKQFVDYPDVVLMSDIEKMTGFSKTGITQWIHRNELKPLMNKKGLIKKGFHVPKEYLIDFLVSPNYRRIKNKSEKQKKDMRQFEIWYRQRMKKGGEVDDGSE